LKLPAVRLRRTGNALAGSVPKENSYANLIWFQGAAAMLNEAVKELQEMLHAAETVQEEKPSDPGDLQKE
jgi:hypothetical protein